MNDLTAFPPLFARFLPSRPHRPAVFRLPRHMHVPAKIIRIHFDLEPDFAWLTASFRRWLRPAHRAAIPWLPAP